MAANSNSSSNTSSRNSSYDSLFSEASTWPNSIQSSANTSTENLSSLNKNSQKETQTEPSVFEESNFAEEVLATSYEQLKFIPAPNYYTCFRNNAINTARNMSSDTRLAIIQMGIQLSKILPSTEKHSIKWSIYASRINSLYSPQMYDSYQLLNQRAQAMIYKLNALQLTPFPNKSQLRTQPYEYSNHLHSWVQTNIISGVEQNILASSPYIKSIVTKRQGLNAIVREKLIFSYFWENQTEIKALFIQNDETTNNNINDVDRNLEMFQCFTCTPRYLFLMNLLRIASLISKKIQDAVLESEENDNNNNTSNASHCMNKFLACSIDPTHLIKASHTSPDKYERLINLVPISLDQFKSFFSTEIFPQSRAKYYSLSSSCSSVFGSKLAMLYSNGQKKNQDPQNCLFRHEHVNLELFNNANSSSTNSNGDNGGNCSVPESSTSGLNLSFCPGCSNPKYTKTSSSADNKKSETLNYVENSLVLLLGSEASFIDYKGLNGFDAHGPTLRVISGN